MKEKLQQSWFTIKKYIPLVSFLGGFVWDSLTLGKTVQSSDFLMLSGYYVFMLGILFLIQFKQDIRYKDKLLFVLQFLFGSLFSALFIFYFKSSGSWPAYIFVAFLCALLVGNEFMEEQYGRGTLSWALATLCGIMYLNFALPHWFHSVHAIWFYLSTAIGLGVIYLLFRKTPSEPKVIYPSYGVAAVLTIMYILNWIPPVPLVLKEQIVCHDYVKENGEYTCMSEKKSLLEWVGLGNPRFTRVNGEPLWVLTSVFAPEKIQTRLEYRFFYKSPKEGWQPQGKVPIAMFGGRQDGYRFYGKKQNLPEGKWKVQTALSEGGVLGVTYFTVKNGDTPAEKVKRILP